MKKTIKQLSSGMDTLGTGAKALDKATDQVSTGVGQLVKGGDELAKGIGTFKNGLNEFRKKAIDKLLDLLDGDVKNIIDRVEAIQALPDQPHRMEK